jgi:hypothetical protein
LELAARPSKGEVIAAVSIYPPTNNGSFPAFELIPNEYSATLFGESLYLDTGRP